MIGQGCQHWPWARALVVGCGAEALVVEAGKGSVCEQVAAQGAVLG